MGALLKFKNLFLNSSIHVSVSCLKFFWEQGQGINKYKYLIPSFNEEGAKLQAFITS